MPYFTKEKKHIDDETLEKLQPLLAQYLPEKCDPIQIYRDRINESIILELKGSIMRVSSMTISEKVLRKMENYLGDRSKSKFAEIAIIEKMERDQGGAWNDL